MKRSLIHLLAIISLCILFITIHHTTSYAVGQSINQCKYYVEIKEDGSADVTETWKIYITDTNILFKKLEIKEPEKIEITNIKIQEITDKGKTEYKEMDTYTYHIPKGYYYALSINSSECQIIWGIGMDNKSATKTYQIHYTIKNAVKKYNDCSEFCWKFIGKANTVPAKDIKGTIKLPNNTLGKENIKAWIHGPLYGNIHIVDNRTITFDLDYLLIKTMLETRIAVEQNIFTQNTNIENKDKLSKIVKEEAKRTNNTKNKIEKLKNDITIEPIIGNIIIIIYMGIVITIVKKIIKKAKEIRKINKELSEQKIKKLIKTP